MLSLQTRAPLLLLLTGLLLIPFSQAADHPRRPASDPELRFWLENMVWHHRFTHNEIAQATGLTPSEITSALERFKISPETRPARPKDAPLLVLPYPGGRHPRIGFLEGAIDPQRDTKLSIFTPWDPHSYVVADIPEAIWSNLGLTYLAHTHIPTIWSEKPPLEKLEWIRLPNGDYKMERTLPNGIRFGTHVRPSRDALLMKMWLHNGTAETLTDLRVQNCIMLKGAEGFTEQTKENKLLRPPFAAARSATGSNWVITAWTPLHRAWQNPPVPCIHSDPKFPGTKPGEQSTLRGWLSFYSGPSIHAELDRIAASDWQRRIDF